MKKAFRIAAVTALSIGLTTAAPLALATNGTVKPPPKVQTQTQSIEPSLDWLFDLFSF